MKRNSGFHLFQTEFKSKKDCKNVSKVMTRYNIISSILAIVLFTVYIMYTVRQASNTSLTNFQKTAVETTRQITEYLSVQRQNLSDIVYYIERGRLSEMETIDSLAYSNSLEGNIMLVSPSSYKGYVIRSRMGEKDKGRAGYQEVDLSENTVIRALCEETLAEDEVQDILDELDIPDENDEDDEDDEDEEDDEQEDIDESKIAFEISDVFENPVSHEKAFALYCPIVRGENSYLFCYMMDTSLILNKIARNSTLIERGILIDADGNLLSGMLEIKPDDTPGLEETDKRQEETQKLLDSLKNKTTNRWVKKGLSTDTCGVFIIKEGRHIHNIYLYVKIKSLGDWYYVSRISKEPLVDVKMIVLLIAGAFCLIAVPWCINVLVVFWQNRRLMKMLITLEDSNEQLASANKAQTAFISSMSHEIRTPINAVLGMDEMIIRETGEKHIREYAYDIQNAGKSLLGIVNDILDFTKIEAGKMDIIEDEYAISSVVNDLVNMTRVRIGDKKLDFRVELNPHMPHVLLGDEIHIKQIILNILTNAVKYTKQGGIVFQIDFEKIDEEQIDLFVAVKDTGIGMKPEEMDKLFKPFERLDEKKNRTIEGTGLGMSIVTGLLSQMDSKIEVQSEYGKGSVFSFHVKQKVIDWSQTGPYTERVARMQEEYSEEKALFIAHKARILVVDDTAANLTVVKGLLKRTQAIVDTASSGKECLEMLEKDHYHIILLDHRMPDMDGVETLHYIRLLENENRDAIVIALTANAISGAREFYLKEGFTDYLTKPINGRKLEQTLVKYLPEEVIDSEEDMAVMVDTEAGRKNCGSGELYLQTVTEVVHNADKIKEEIEQFLEADDISNYTIKVHALKSTARFLGAINLSEEAYYLEQCGDAQDREQIKEKTPTLLAHFETVIQSLKKQYELEEKQDKPLMELRELTEALEAICEFNAAFDFDQVDEIIKIIEAHTIPQNAEETVNALKRAVYDVDQEHIEQVIKTYLGGQGNE